jgi:hypothetical protein
MERGAWSVERGAWSVEKIKPQRRKEKISYYFFMQVVFFVL